MGELKKKAGFIALLVVTGFVGSVALTFALLWLTDWYVFSWEVTLAIWLALVALQAMFN